MNRIESFVIASALAVGVPLLLLTLGWLCLIALWILEGEIGELPGSAVVTVLVMIVFVGTAIDIWCLRRWTQGFYQANMPLMIFLFLICSLASIALFMGVPIGNLALGILAGLYTGRRYYHGGRGPEAFAGASRRVGLFTGAVVAAVALPVGLLALVAGEEYIAKSIVESLGFTYSNTAGVGLVVALCVLLMLIQYLLARSAAILAYRGWKKTPPELEAKAPRQIL